MTPTQEATKLEADLCVAFVEPIRILILYALDERPHNVTEICRRLNAPQPAVSRHLKVLRNLGMVKATKLGNVVIYELTDRRFIEALNILRSALRDSVASKSDLVSRAL